uniref:FlgO family outer membrane protein n=1 Tax=Alistipes sp. TaxID=1872444 RepID=UPI0040578409
MISFGVFAQPSTKKVGIYITGEINANYKKVIVSKMISQITQTDGFVAVERTNEFLSALSREQDYQLSGAVSDNDIARLGAQFGVHYVLVADLSELFEEVFVSARAIDVETAQIIAATETNSKVDSMQSLTDLANNLSKNFIRAIKYQGILSKVKSVKLSGNTLYEIIGRIWRQEIIKDVDLLKYILDNKPDIGYPVVIGIDEVPQNVYIIRQSDPRYNGLQTTSDYYDITYISGSGYWEYTTRIECVKGFIGGRYEYVGGLDVLPINMLHCIYIDE